jgi:hypothetical protein
MKLRARLGLACALALLSLRAAGQDKKRECIEASTAGQTSRDAGEMLKARAQFLTCASDACPSVVRSSCSRWLSDVELQIPSIVIRAADAANVDITDGTASIDGEPVPLDGKPILLDPGTHSIVVDAPSGAHLEKKVLLATGEKSRLIELRASPPPAPRAPLRTAETSPALAVEPGRSASVGPWLLAGSSLVALGSFTYFAVSAKSELNRLQTTCSPACSAADAESGRRDALLADISLGVSLAALTGAITWALLNDREAAPKSASRLSLAASRRGGFARLDAEF